MRQIMYIELMVEYLVQYKYVKKKKKDEKRLLREHNRSIPKIERLKQEKDLMKEKEEEDE